MTYQQFDETKPDAATQNGSQFATSTRENLAAIRDMVVMGVAPGWRYWFSGGAAAQPNQMVWDRDGERLRAVCTWGDAGGEEDNLRQAIFEYRTDSSAPWQYVGRMSISYNVDGDVTSTYWYPEGE